MRDLRQSRTELRPELVALTSDACLAAASTTTRTSAIATEESWTGWAAPPPPPATSPAVLMNEAAWHADGCMGMALALDQQDDHVELPGPSLCALSDGAGFSLVLCHAFRLRPRA